MRNWGSRTDKEKRIRSGINFAKGTPIFLIILAFLFNILSLDLAWAIETETMPSPIGEGTSVGPGQASLLSPYDIEIPRAYGTIKERYEPDEASKGLIVYIQDLHTHYRAHKNIEYIIEGLERDL